jgi:ligand-binding sensor domain-containing protein
VQPTAICSLGGHVWVGTQGRGILRYGREGAQWFDERHGLGDDWITCLEVWNGRLYAGTFVGGLYFESGGKWASVEGLDGQNVTALAEFGGKLYCGTRSGLYVVGDSGARRHGHPGLDGEVQAILPGRGGLWIGLRTELLFVTAGSLNRSL